ncbi:MAG: DedA family protein, partial [Candidatus Thermoplasmatota archaeon]
MPSLFLGLTQWIAQVVAAIGYPGIFALMVIEGILTPIPSEFIMPFAGYLSAQGLMHPVLAILAGTAGAAVG